MTEKKSESKQERPSDYMEQLVAWAVVRKLNVDLDWCRDEEYPTRYFVRLRPWSNKDGSAKMYCGWGADYFEAGKFAMRRWVDENGQRMDWAWRPWNDERVVRLDRDSPAEIPF